MVDRKFHLEDRDTTSVAYDVLSKLLTVADIGAVLRTKTPIVPGTYFTKSALDIDERPRSVLKQAATTNVIQSTKGSGIHPIKQRSLDGSTGGISGTDRHIIMTAHLICAASNYDDALCSDAPGGSLIRRGPMARGEFDGQATAETAYCIQVWRIGSGSLSAQISRAGGVAIATLRTAIRAVVDCQALTARRR